MVKYFKIGVIGLFILIGICFHGSIEEKDYKGIYYDHVSYSDNVSFYGIDGLSINYSANLSQLGESYELYFDVVNDSSVDVEIANYFVHKDDPYVEYQLSYGNGNTIQLGDIIKQGESKQLKYKVQYKNPIIEEDYQFDSSFQIQYEQII